MLMVNQLIGFGAGGLNLIGDLVAPTLNSNQGDGGNYGFRQHVATAAYGLAVNASAVRITLRPPTSGSSPTLTSVWIGHTTSAPTYDGNQVQVLFGGSAAPTLTAGGGDTVSDIMPFAFDVSKALLVGLGATANWTRSNTSISNYTLYYNSGQASNAGVTSGAGYSSIGTRCDLLAKIELFG